MNPLYLIAGVDSVEWCPRVVIIYHWKVRMGGAGGE